MEERRLHLALVATQLVAAATLVRSIAYDRWITVLASVLLLIGAAAAKRGKTWGIALSLASAAAFPVAFAIGIAPAWFCLVGMVGALPFAFTSRAFARFDKGATTLLAVLAATGGAIGAMAWKEMAWSVFYEIPLLRPSIEAQHGLALTALVATVTVATLLTRKSGSGAADLARLRVGAGETRSRIDTSSSSAASSALDLDFEREEEMEVAEPRRQHLPR